MWQMECTVDIVNADVSIKIILKKLFGFKKCHVINLIFFKSKKLITSNFLI